MYTDDRRHRDPNPGSIAYHTKATLVVNSTERAIYRVFLLMLFIYSP